MSATRKPIDGFAAGTMLLLCAIWGAQQVAIKLAAHDVAPIVQVTVRSGLSALLVTALEVWRSGRVPLRGRNLRPGLLAGALFGVEFLFVAEGLRSTSASHVVVFLYTAPVFTALGLHLLVPAVSGAGSSGAGCRPATFGEAARDRASAPATATRSAGDAVGR